MYYNQKDYSKENDIIDFIKPDNGIGYQPFIIKKWCHKVIHDDHSSSEERIEASDLLFQYFVNNMTQPNPRNLYKICHDKKNPDKLILIKDNTNSKKEFIISANGRQIRCDLTTEEFNLLKNIFGDLQIDNYIEEFNI